MKLNERCVEENIRYIFYFKKYVSYVPLSLNNKPKFVVANLLKKGNCNRNNDQTTPEKFLVQSALNFSDDVIDFEVDFGNEMKFFSCSCPSFKTLKENE